LGQRNKESIKSTVNVLQMQRENSFLQLDLPVVSDWMGVSVGDAVLDSGELVGALVGLFVGDFVGNAVGCFVGCFVGDFVGADVGGPAYRYISNCAFILSTCPGVNFVRHA
jgi:uncharacterized protein YcfJ